MSHVRRIPKSAVLLFGLHVTVGATAALGDPVQLDTKSIAEAIVGRTIAVDTPIAVTLPVTFHSEGRMTGEAGALAFYLGSRRDEGRWWIAKGRLCQRWQNWLGGERSCMTLARDGRTLHWTSDDGKTGTATITHQIALGRSSQPIALGGPGPTLERDRGRLDDGFRFEAGRVTAEKSAAEQKPSAQQKDAVSPRRLVPPVRRSAPDDRKRLAALTASAAQPSATPVKRAATTPPVARTRSAARPAHAPTIVAPKPKRVTAHGRTMHGVVALTAPSVRASRWCHAGTDPSTMDGAPALLWHVRSHFDGGSAEVRHACMSSLPDIVAQGRRAARGGATSTTTAVAPVPPEPRPLRTARAVR
jgi:hypothetical protein